MSPKTAKAIPWEHLKGRLSNFKHDHGNLTGWLISDTSTLQGSLPRQKIVEFTRSHGGLTPKEYVERAFTEIRRINDGYTKWRTSQKDPGVGNARRTVESWHRELSPARRAFQTRVAEVICFMDENVRHTAQNDALLAGMCVKFRQETKFDLMRLLEPVPHPEKFDIDKSVRTMIDLSTPKRKAKLASDSKRIGKVRADPLLVDGAIVNLFENAFLHGSGNVIDVKTWKLGRGTLAIGPKGRRNRGFAIQVTNKVKREVPDNILKVIIGFSDQFLFKI